VEDQNLNVSKESFSGVRELFSKAGYGSWLIFFLSIATGFVAIFVYFQSRHLSGANATAFVLTFAFSWVVVSACIFLIFPLSAPVTQLAVFLDGLREEDDLPTDLPEFRKRMRPLLPIVESVEKLFQRLRSYRALSFKRLLIEKRMSEIIAASMSDGIFLLRDDEILYVNPVAEKILGILPRAFTKGLKLNADNPVLNVNALKSVKLAVCSSLPVDFVLSGDDRKLYYLFQAFPLSEDLIEEVEHSVGNSMERVLERFQANILVLAQNVTLVREGNEAKSHFLATLSHEVKTPVTSLTMATRLLRRSIDQIPNPTHRSLITTCADDVDRLRRLLDDLMTISRFDTLTQRLEIQKIDFGKLLTHSVQSFQIQANEREVELTYKIQNHGKPLIIEMDAAKITWAISNLITNAIRHTPKGGKVEVLVVSNLERAEIKIRDSGPGIDRQRQERIFDKFNSYYDLRVARSGSVGAGLAIAKEIVVAHGGRIWVSSDPGHGAEFCFALPLKCLKANPSSDEDSIRSIEKWKDLNKGKISC